MTATTHFLAPKANFDRCLIDEHGHIVSDEQGNIVTVN